MNCRKLIKVVIPADLISDLQHSTCNIWQLEIIRSVAHLRFSHHAEYKTQHNSRTLHHFVLALSELLGVAHAAHCTVGAAAVTTEASPSPDDCDR